MPVTSEILTGEDMYVLWCSHILLRIMDKWYSKHGISYQILEERQRNFLNLGALMRQNKTRFPSFSGLLGRQEWLLSSNWPENANAAGHSAICLLIPASALMLGPSHTWRASSGCGHWRAGEAATTGSHSTRKRKQWQTLYPKFVVYCFSFSVSP